MRRAIGRLLIVVFLANVLGLAAVQAGADEHDADIGYSHTDGTDKHDSSPCAHPCHVGFHFMGLTAAGLPVPRTEAGAQVTSLAATVRSASLSIPFHPPRPLA